MIYFLSKHQSRIIGATLLFGFAIALILFFGQPDNLFHLSSPDKVRGAETAVVARPALNATKNQPRPRIQSLQPLPGPPGPPGPPSQTNTVAHTQSDTRQRARNRVVAKHPHCENAHGILFPTALARMHGAPHVLGSSSYGQVAPNADRKQAECGALLTATELLLELGANEHASFEPVRTFRDRLGKHHTRLQLYAHDLPVVSALFTVHTNSHSGDIYYLSGNMAQTRFPDPNAAMGADKALARAMEQLARSVPFEATWVVRDSPQLDYVKTTTGDVHYAWNASVQYTSNAGLQVDRIFADANHGTLVARHPQRHSALHRTVELTNYLGLWLIIDTLSQHFIDSLRENNDVELKTHVELVEGGTTDNSHVQAIYDNIGITYRFFETRFGRLGLFGLDKPIVAITETDGGHPNARFDGERLIFGAGNARDTMGPYETGRDLDTSAHEYAHAISNFDAELGNSNEAGAINEAFSDIMSAAVEAFHEPDNFNGIWYVAEDVYTYDIDGDAERYMNDPTRDGQSADFYPDLQLSADDNGRVHFNSGIANLAFYLLSEGGTHPRGKTSIVVTGLGIKQAQTIFYRAFAKCQVHEQATCHGGHYVGPDNNFSRTADDIAQAAFDLYGKAAAEQALNAWKAVGVKPNATLAVETFTKELVAGWNLISLPFTPTNPDLDAIIPLTVRGPNIWAWNSRLQKYYDVSHLEMIRGYWVYVEKPYTLTTKGTYIRHATWLESYWNLTSPTQLSAAHPETEEAVQWNPTTREYDEIDLTAERAFEPGTGYWIRNRTAAYWQFGPSKNQVLGDTTLGDQSIREHTTSVVTGVLRAPTCFVQTASCQTTDELVGTNANREPNAPNTLDGCADGSHGTFQIDESIDKISITSADGSDLTVGERAHIDVTVWAPLKWYAGDRLDIFYTTNITKPDWQHLETAQVQKSGPHTIRFEHTIPAGANPQAIRAQLRWGDSNANACHAGDYNDRDDVVFVPAPAQ